MSQKSSASRFRPARRASADWYKPTEQLEVNKPGDAHEQEAERAEASVKQGQAQPAAASEAKMTQPASRQPASQVQPMVQRAADEEQREEVQLKREGQGNRAVPRWVAAGINNGRGGGKPLEEETRHFMEGRFGSDLSNVRIHDDGSADHLSGALNAKAFTVGQDIWFKKGRFNPESKDGKGLLAHELTHTVQQKNSSDHVVQRAPGEPFKPEREHLSVLPEIPYADRDTMSDAEMTQAAVDRGTYTTLTPSRLDQAGPFTYELLRRFAHIYTVRAAYHSPESGQKVLDAIEASSTLVAQIQRLDRHYARTDTPQITIHWGDGSRFVPVGVANQAWDSWAPSISKEYDTIQLDLKMDVNSDTAVLENVDTIAHEITHAYRHAREFATTTRGTLTAALDEEKHTRENESVIMGEIAGNASLSTALRTEATTMLGAKPTAITRESVGLSLMSGYGITYVENFYVGPELSRLQAAFKAIRKSERNALPGFADLPPVHEAANAENDEVSDAIKLLIMQQTKSTEIMTPLAEAWATSAAFGTDQQEQNDPSLPWNRIDSNPLGEAASVMMMRLLNNEVNLQDIKSMSVSGMTTQEQTLALYLMVLEVMLIRKALSNGWRGDGRGLEGEPRKAFGNQQAAQYLGLTAPYDSL